MFAAGALPVFAATRSVQPKLAKSRSPLFRTDTLTFQQARTRMSTQRFWQDLVTTSGLLRTSGSFAAARATFWLMRVLAVSWVTWLRVLGI